MLLKAASFKYLLNDVIAGQNDPIYNFLPTSVIWTQKRSTAQAKQQTKIQILKTNNYNNSGLNCPSQETEVTSTPTRPVENVITTKGLQDRNNLLLDGRTVENKGKLILRIKEVYATDLYLNKVISAAPFFNLFMWIFSTFLSPFLTIICTLNPFPNNNTY